MVARSLQLEEEKVLEHVFYQLLVFGGSLPDFYSLVSLRKVF